MKILRAGLCVVILAAATLWSCSGGAATENGNDMCLSLSEAMEAEDLDEIESLREESKGVNYFFRYLEILEIKSGREGGRPYADILTREPSSYLKLKFKKGSLSK